MIASVRTVKLEAVVILGRVWMVFAIFCQPNEVPQFLEAAFLCCVLKHVHHLGASGFVWMVKGFVPMDTTIRAKGAFHVIVAILLGFIVPADAVFQFCLVALPLVGNIF